jgi:predicted MFS family arabinose efflux permease
VVNVFSSYLGLSKDVWKLIGAGFINSSGLVIPVYLALFLNSLDYQAAQIGVVIALFGTGGMLGGFLGGYLADKLEYAN